MSPRFGELPGLDNHLTPEDDDDRTQEEIDAEEEARADAAISRAEDREYEDNDGPWV